MKNATRLDRPQLTLAVVLTLFAGATPSALAQSAVKLQGTGAITLSPQGTSVFALAGTASHLGRYVCFGELALVPGAIPGTFTGGGVAVFRAANGDLLVGLVTCKLDGTGIGCLAFHWQDSVRFSDGTALANTGRFVRSRPPGAVSPLRYVFNPLVTPNDPKIIAILIGL